MNEKGMQGQIIKEVGNPNVLSFFASHCHSAIHISIKFHQNIPSGYRVTEKTQRACCT